MKATPVLMVVKHIRVNEQNKKAWERKLKNQKKDWMPLLIVGLVVLVAAVGLLLLNGLV